MSFPATLLTEGEEVLVESKQHWIALRDELLSTLAWVFLWIVIVPWLDFPLDEWIAWLLTLAWLTVVGSGVAEWYGTDLVVTNKRIIFRKGLFTKSGHEVPLERLVDLGQRQSMWQGLVGAGDLLLDTGGHNGKVAIGDIPGPEHVITVINDARAGEPDDARVGESSEGPPGETTMTPPKPVQTSLPDHRSPGSKSRAEQLEILARLNAEGKLTDDEFAAEKARVLESD